MTQTCPTVKVKADNEQGFIVINEADFDAKTHEAFDPEAAKKALNTAELRVALTAKGIAFPEAAKKALNTAELRVALTAKGIAFPEAAKKAELQALLDAAE